MESLTLTADLFMDSEVLLRRLGLGCTRIEQLEWFCSFVLDDGYFEAFESFKKLESLELFELEPLLPPAVESLIELSLLNDSQFAVERYFDDPSF